MKLSELQQAIEEIIIEILSPKQQKAKASSIAAAKEDLKDATNDLKVASNTLQKKAAQDQIDAAKEDLAQAAAVNEAEDEDDDSPAEKEPSKTDVKKSEKGLSFTPEEKKTKFNQFLASVKKNKGDKAKIDGILKLAKDKFKFTKAMLDDLKRTAGRNVE